MPSAHASISTSISAPTTPAPNPPSLAPAFGSFAVNLQSSAPTPSLPPLPAALQHHRGRPPAVPFHVPTFVSLLLLLKLC